MSKSKKPKPATVSFTAKQAGETQVQFPFGEENSRWAWVEPSVWTDRMLTALENGVKGGKWFSLIDKVYSLANLESAATEVAGNGGAAGVDRVTTEIRCTRRRLRLSMPRPRGLIFWATTLNVAIVGRVRRAWRSSRTRYGRRRHVPVV
jgi:hypothetical protein